MNEQEAFENYYQSTRKNTVNFSKYADGEYILFEIDFAYQFWQAALASQEPVGEVHNLSRGWECYIWQKAVDDGLVKDGDFVYTSPQPYLTERVKELEAKLEVAEDVMEIHGLTEVFERNLKGR
jgi:hypothetical protein